MVTPSATPSRLRSLHATSFETKWTTRSHNRVQWGISDPQYSTLEVEVEVQKWDGMVVDSRVASRQEPMPSSGDRAVVLGYGFHAEPG